METSTVGPRPAAGDRRIGAYRLLKELGHGGMGVVYLAARADEQYEKRVAIKVMKAGMDGAEITRRFRRERQILAALEHPNIARLLDGGATEEGLPYLVMEHIEGRPLHEYCDQRRLPIDARLRIFQQVCSAVAYAHRNLVVHLDLKPSNVLVTAEGVPRLLDFGIAKLLNPELATEAPTATGLAMTPEYASPEQARGEPITTASDVYSLGVILYELLTGQRPYRFGSRHPLEVLRAVVEQEPLKPSTAVERMRVKSVLGPEQERSAPPTALAVSATREATPARLERKLRGDLDNIVLTALRKEPHRRYVSVEAFSEDIRRYLERRPVRAARATVAYRLGKFVRRNRAVVAAGALVASLLAAFAVSMALQSARLQRERDRAQLERDRAESATARAERERENAQRVAAFMADLFKVSDPERARGREVTARDVLDEGAKKIDRELAGQPEVQAALLETVGTVYRRLGAYDQARSLLERAVALRRNPGTTPAELAGSLHALAGVRYAQGDHAGAEPLVREALELRRQSLGQDHPDVGRLMGNLAALAEARGDRAAAESLYRQVLAAQRRHGDPAQAEVARTANNLALLLSEKGEHDEAAVLLGEALDINRRQLGNDHPDVASRLANLGSVLAVAGQAARAEPLQIEALALKRKLLGLEHPEVAIVLSELADTRKAMGRRAEAERDYRASLRLCRKAVPAGHPDLAPPLLGLGDLLTDDGRTREAEPLLREALAVRAAALPPDHPQVMAARASLGACLARRGRIDEGRRLLQEASTGLASRPPASWEARKVRERLAVVSALLDAHE